jgi:hypothetical protein
MIEHRGALDPQLVAGGIARSGRRRRLPRARRNTVTCAETAADGTAHAVSRAANRPNPSTNTTSQPPT